MIFRTPASPSPSDTESYLNSWGRFRVSVQQREDRAMASQDRWLKAVTAAGSWTFFVERESSNSVVEGSGF